MTWLSNISQKTLAGVGDWDECWIAATYTAVRYSYPKTPLPSVTAFRAAANNPDRPGPTGGTLTDIMEGVTTYWPELGVREFRRNSWDNFTAYLKAGWVASVGVLSSRLPSALRYGFEGYHQIAVQYLNGDYWLCNPLASTGTLPQKVSEGALKAAVLSFTGSSSVAAVLFPNLEVLVIYTRENKVGRFVIPAQGSPVGYALKSGGFRAMKQWAPRTETSSGPFAHVLTRVGPDPDYTFNVMLYIPTGFFAGLYIKAAAVTETYAPVVSDAELTAKVATLTAELAAKEAITTAAKAALARVTSALAEVKL